MASRGTICIPGLPGMLNSVAGMFMCCAPPAPILGDYMLSPGIVLPPILPAPPPIRLARSPLDWEPAEAPPPSSAAILSF